MIRLIDKSNAQPVIKKKMSHNPDIFIQARDFYYEHEEYRREQIAVTDSNDEIIYMLAWEHNEVDFLGKNRKSVQNLYVSEFWKYSIDDPRMDFEYIKDIDVFVFKYIEEYSIAVTQIIKKYFPDKKVYFADERAKLFFDDILIGDATLEDNRSVIRVGSDLMFDLAFGVRVLDKVETNSVNLMSSIYWLTDTVSYGELNPDKVFYVVKCPIASSGLVKFISFLLYFVYVAEKRKDMNVIPVIDTAISGDDNQFNDGEYKDVWTMFFAPISDVSIEEVYNSKNVIVGQEGKMGVNPYLMYVEYHSNIGSLMKEHLKLNDEIDKYCRAVREDLGIEEGSKVLGVIGRGSDFNNPVVAKLHTLPLDPAGIVDKAREIFEKGEYDRIFLATEDQNVYDTFMSSNLADVTSCIDQKRYSIDASKELLHNRYVEESKAGNRNGFEEARGYLSILEMLRRCDGIIASTDCGAVDYAMAMHDGEFSDLYIHGKS